MGCTQQVVFYDHKTRKRSELVCHIKRSSMAAILGLLLISARASSFSVNIKLRGMGNLYTETTEPFKYDVSKIW